MVFKNISAKIVHLVLVLSFISFSVQSLEAEVTYDLSAKIKKLKAPKVAELLKQYEKECLTPENADEVLDEETGLTKGLKAMAAILKALMEGNGVFEWDKKSDKYRVMHWFNEGEEPENPAPIFFGIFKKQYTEVRDALYSIAGWADVIGKQAYDKLKMKKAAWSLERETENVNKTILFASAALLDALRSLLYPSEKSGSFEAEQSMSNKINRKYMQVLGNNSPFQADDNSFMNVPKYKQYIDACVIAQVMTKQELAKAQEDLETEGMSTVEKIKHKGKKLTKQASEKMLQAKKAVTSSKKKKKLTAEEEEALMRSMELKEGEEDPAVKRLRGD